MRDNQVDVTDFLLFCKSTQDLLDGDVAVTKQSCAMTCLD
ncbi:hypothetical protein RCCS2_04654 [Roseobacter sp. CCS2]|nr:hypothetical protein RCCS2_04654 [Roseobacter sp. CCS2]